MKIIDRLLAPIDRMIAHDLDVRQRWIDARIAATLISALDSGAEDDDEDDSEANASQDASQEGGAQGRSATTPAYIVPRGGDRHDSVYAVDLISVPWSLREEAFRDLYEDIVRNGVDCYISGRDTVRIQYCQEPGMPVYSLDEWGQRWKERHGVS